MILLFHKIWSLRRYVIPIVPYLLQTQKLGHPRFPELSLNQWSLDRRDILLVYCFYFYRLRIPSVHLLSSIFTESALLFLLSNDMVEHCVIYNDGRFELIMTYNCIISAYIKPSYFYWQTSKLLKSYIGFVYYNPKYHIRFSLSQNL